MTKRHDDLMKLTKAELVEQIIGLEKSAAKADLAERDVIIRSPAGPRHTFHGFVDDGQGPIVLDGLPEDELGHWEPFYSLRVNDQDLGRPEIGRLEMSNGT